MLAEEQGLQREGGTDAFRPLHTKSLILSDDDRALVMMGSSNFATAGLGIGEHARNIEGQPRVPGLPAAPRARVPGDRRDSARFETVPDGSAGGRAAYRRPW